MATAESDAGVKKIYLHMREVEGGLIPESSPPDFVRADWKPDERGLPGWFGPQYHPEPHVLEAFKREQLEDSARREAHSAAKSPEALKRESKARLDRLHHHVQQVLDGTIPEAAPYWFILTEEMKATGQPPLWMAMGADPELERG
jgi:hypothetical protein